MKQPDIKRVTEFVRLLHAFQSVERMIFTPGLARRENDVEHSYLLAMLCWYLVDAFGLKLDKKKVLEYALVHDLVEVYAGDTYFLDAEGRKSKHEREEKSRVRLAEEFPEFNDMHMAIVQYEKHIDPEAVFVREADKLIPLIANYLQGGYGWKQHNVRADELFAHKRTEITKHKEVRDILEQFIEELESHRSDFFN